MVRLNRTVTDCGGLYERAGTRGYPEELGRECVCFFACCLFIDVVHTAQFSREHFMRQSIIFLFGRIGVRDASNE